MLTYVGAWDDKQMAAAIRRELLRDGQVFVIHNRVQSIDKAAAKIRNLVPEARVAVGHGQMKEHELERIMVGFWEKEYDVLVATTIVESGLDIPNANTLIVDRADTFGLSQLHQIRGRVGPWPRARLRLLHLRPDPAADRDLGRPADHDRAQHRPRRRHGRGDEGPRDPRLGQPARRRAVRAHRRRRLRPLRPAGRRGGRRLPRAGRPARSPRSSRSRSGSTCRSTRTCRTTTCPASGCGWRPTARSPRCRTTTRRRRCSTSSPTATAPRRPRCSTCWPSPGSGRRCGRSGVTEVSLQGRAIRISPVALRESQQMRAGPAGRRRHLQGRGRDDLAQGAGRPRPADAAARRRAAGEPARAADGRPRAAGGRRLVSAAARPGDARRDHSAASHGCRVGTSRAC